MLVTPSSPSPLTEPRDDQLISKRVESIQSAYAELGQLTDRRRTLLQDAIRLFQFNRECNDFEVWMRDKEKFLKQEDPTQTVEAAKHAFEVRRSVTAVTSYFGWCARLCGTSYDSSTSGFKGRCI